MYVATLRGTDKQRRWAESIRERVISVTGYKRSTFPDLDYRLAWLCAIPDAHWWIKNKDVSPDVLLTDLEMKPTRLRYYDLYTAEGVSAWAQGIYDTIILDTETTGLGEDAELVELAVIDLEGQALINTLLRPTRPIPADATAIHHISDEMVRNAPTFSEVWPSLRALLCLYRVVIYNAKYDLPIIKRMAKETALPCPSLKVDCAMIAYASYRRIEDTRSGGYKWHKLENACCDLGVQVTGTSHRALTDCKATLDVIRRLRDACEQRDEYEWMIEEPKNPGLAQDELPGLMVEEPAPTAQKIEETPRPEDQELVSRLVAYVQRRTADNPAQTFYAKGAWDAYGKTLDGPGYLVWFNELLCSPESEKQNWAREEIARRLR